MVGRRSEASGFDGVDGLFIHPVQDERVMAGNGTIGLELLEDLPDSDAVLVPCRRRRADDRDRERGQGAATRDARLRGRARDGRAARGRDPRRPRARRDRVHGLVHRRRRARGRCCRRCGALRRARSTDAFSVSLDEAAAAVRTARRAGARGRARAPARLALAAALAAAPATADASSASSRAGTSTRPGCRRSSTAAYPSREAPGRIVGLVF